MTGWFSVHRKLKESAVFSDPFILKLWMLCLMKVSYTDHEQLVGRQMVKLQPGEFVTGRYSLAEEYNRGVKKDMIVSERTLWRWLKNFEEWEMLSIKSTTKYSVITVINWHQYQTSDQQVSSSRPSNDQQVSTNNKGNKGNKENNKEVRHKQVYDTDSPYFILADFFYKEILRNNSNHKEPNLQTWSEEFRKIIELDKRDKKEVSKLIRFVQRDDFEMVNVLSPAKLRKRYDNLAMKMNKSSGNFQSGYIPTEKPIDTIIDINAGEDW